MNQGNYINESTENLIRRAQQTLGNVPVLDLRNWQTPVYTQGIKSLAPACHGITVKNPITVDDSSIIVCTDTTTGSCGAIPPNCQTGPLSPADYVNMVATITAGFVQTGVVITFKYVLNGTPLTTPVTVDLVAGSNTVYAFATNVQYSADTTLVLYGAEVTTY